MKFVIGIDPGRSKVGLALLTAEGELLERSIVPRREASEAIERLARMEGAHIIALGDGTESVSLADELRGSGKLPEGLQIVMVDEADSTTEGRRLYLMENRGCILSRIIPIGLRVPERPWDDYVAEVIARRYVDGIKQKGSMKDNAE